MYLIEVKGEIIVRGGKQHAYTWTCESTGKQSSEILDNYNLKTLRHVIDSNLVLSETRRALPFAIYYAHGGIRVDSAYSNGDIIADLGNSGIFAYFDETIESIKKKLIIPIDPLIEDTLYNGLFSEVFSALELLLCDIFLDGIFKQEDIKQRAKQYWENKINKERINKITFPAGGEPLEKVLYNHAINHVYHKFDITCSMFEEILNVKISSPQKLKEHLHRRNNISHRSAISNLDLMTRTIPTKETIVSLINDTIEWVEEIKSKVS